MKYKEFITENSMSKDSIPDMARKSVDTINKELGRIFPENQIKAFAKYGENLGRSITITVYSENASTNVTRHNSSAHVQIMTFLSDGSGNARDMGELSAESNTQTGVKFRKMRAKNFDDYTKKIVMWFKKNRQAFVDGIYQRI